MTRADKKKLEELRADKKKLVNNYNTLRNTVIFHMDNTIANECGASHAMIELGKMIEDKNKEIEELEKKGKSKVRFLMHAVTDGVHKSKVWYSPSTDFDGNLEYISVHADGYGAQLNKFFDNVRNETDIMTDYFDTDSVKIYPDSPYWNDCKAAMDKVMNKRKMKY